MRKLTTLALIAVSVINASADFEVEKTDHLQVWAEFPDPIVADGKTVNYIKVFEHDTDNQNYTAFNLEFILPEGFRINRVKSGRSEVNDIKYSDRAHDTHSITCNIVDGIDLRIIGDSSENANLYNDDIDGNPLDELFTIGLIAEPTIPSGEYTIQMKGIKFCRRDATARVPEQESRDYTVLIDNPVNTGIDEISIDELDKDNCYDLHGRKVNPTKVQNAIIVYQGHKYLIR